MRQTFGSERCAWLSNSFLTKPVRLTEIGLEYAGLAFNPLKRLTYSCFVVKCCSSLFMSFSWMNLIRGIATGRTIARRPVTKISFRNSVEYVLVGFMAFLSSSFRCVLFVVVVVVFVVAMPLSREASDTLWGVCCAGLSSLLWSESSLRFEDSARVFTSAQCHLSWTATKTKR